MGKLKFYIANAGNSLGKFTDTIKSAIDKVETYAVPTLGIIDEVNIIFAALYDFIPEDHIGGRTYKADYVTISIDETANQLNESTIFQSVCHELAHAVRWAKNPEYATSLLDDMLFEGLATHFQEQAIGDNDMIDQAQYYLKTVKDRSDQENEQILTTLKNELNDQNYNYNEVFFTGNDKLPRWAGYSAGYYLVRKYLKIVNKKPSEVFADNYTDIKKIIELG